MNDDNPYAPPKETGTGIPRFPQGSYFVEAPYLVIAKTANLPANHCVVTNQPTTPTDVIRRTLIWAPSFRIVLGYRRCEISYALNSRRQKTRRILRFFTPALILLAVAILYSSAPQVVLFLFVIPILYYFKQDPITIHKAADGLYWLTGFCPEYIAECEQKLQDVESSDGLP